MLSAICALLYGHYYCTNECRVHHYSTAETETRKEGKQIACFKHDIKAQLQLLLSAPVARRRGMNRVSMQLNVESIHRICVCLFIQEEQLQAGL